MPRITFFIGNGFSLNCGFKSNFSDVYPEYCSSESKSNNIQKFKSLIMNDIKSNVDSWADFEESMGKNMSLFDTADSFVECLSDFKYFLEEFLHKQDVEYRKKIKNQSEIREKIIKELENSANNFYRNVTNDITSKIDSISNDERMEYAVLTLNYLYTDNDIFSLMQNKGKRTDVIHLHGVLGNDMILGMDNVDQLSAPYDISDDVKTMFVKPFFNNMYDRSRQRMATKIIYESDAVCIFGASLGPSDLQWRNTLLKWILNRDVDLFIYTKEGIGAPKLRPPERINIERKMKNNLIQRWEWEGYREDIFNKMHIPCGNNIFDFSKILL